MARESRTDALDLGKTHSERTCRLSGSWPQSGVLLPGVNSFILQRACETAASQVLRYCSIFVTSSRTQRPGDGTASSG
jgi:hypothetical protein